MKQICFCSFCGDPAIRLCKRKHREWIIVDRRDIKAGDLLRREEKIYRVAKVRIGENFVKVQTLQGLKFEFWHPDLPELVKRVVACGWACCEFHCHKCMRFAESEARRDRLLGKRKVS